MEKSVKCKWTAFVLWLSVVVAFGAYLVLMNPRMCMLRICIEKADDIERRMMPAEDKCQDFDKFVCGKSEKYWELNTSITYYSIYKLKTETYYQGILGLKPPLLPAIDATEVKYKSEKLISFLYKDCMRTNIRDNVQITTSRGKVAASVAAVPGILGPKTNYKSGLKIAEYEYTSRRIGFTGQSLFSCYVSADQGTTNEFAIHVGLPVYSALELDEVLALKEVEYFISLMEYIYSMVYEGTPIDPLLATSIYKLELEIASAVKMFSTENESYAKLSLEAMDLIIPTVNWKYYFEKMLLPGTKLPTHIIVTSKNYLYKLQEILKNNDEYSVMWFMISRNCLELGTMANIHDDKFKFLLKRIYTESNLKIRAFGKRNEFCEDVVKKYFKGAISSLLIDKLGVDNGGRQILHSIARKMKEAAIIKIKNISWMDLSTKQVSIKRLKSLKYSLSVSDDVFAELSSSYHREDYYKNYCFNSYDFLKSIFNANRVLLKKNFLLLQQSPSAYDIDYKGYMSGVNYNKLTNELFVPTSILQYPLFNYEFPFSVNFAGIGTAIGREIVHAFFYNIETIDVLNSSMHHWWSNTTMDNYNNKILECNQYLSNNKDFLPIKHDTALIKTLYLELNSLQLAFQAYSNYLEESNLPYPDKTFEDIDFSDDQLFFVSFVNSYCYSTHSRALKTVDGYVENMNIIKLMMSQKNFRKAFRCKNKSSNTIKQLIRKCFSL